MVPETVAPTFVHYRSCSHPSTIRSKPPINNVFNVRKNRKFSLRPMVKKVMTMNADVKKKSASYPKYNDDEVSSRSSSDKDQEQQRVFNPSGYEAHLVDSLEKDILLRNPNVKWTNVAGLQEAKTILQEAMVLPIIMPDFFKVLRKSLLQIRRIFRITWSIGMIQFSLKKFKNF